MNLWNPNLPLLQYRVLICVFFIFSSMIHVLIEEKEILIIEVNDVQDLADLRCLRMNLCLRINLLNSNLPLLQCVY
jgi:hypothetical protein